MTTTIQKQPEKKSVLRRGKLIRTSRRPAPPELVAHVLATLPDSLARREEVLRALAEIIPPGEGSGVWVRTVRFHLEEHQRARLEPPVD